MHNAVEDQREKQRLLNQKRRRGATLVDVSEGDFVLRSRVDEKHANKLQVTWIGPYRVVRADTHSFRVQHLVTGEELDAHASRLKLYADDGLEVTEELLKHVASQGILLAVNSLRGHKWNTETNDYDVLVSWKGLESIEDSYEPLQNLAREIRVLVGNYVTQAGDQKLGEHWAQLTGNNVQTTGSQEAEVAVPTLSPTSDTRVPQSNVEQTGSRLPSRKRRRKPVEEAVSRESQDEGVEAGVVGDVPRRTRTRTRSIRDGSSNRRPGAKDSDPLLPLARQTRSMTALGTSMLEPQSAEHHRPRRSRRRRR